MTMMMWTLTKLIVIMATVIGFVTGMGLFTTTYYETPSGPATSYTMGDVENLLEPSQPQVGDYFGMMVSWAVTSITMILSIALAIVFLFPFLVTIFHMPVALAGVFQVIIYLQYAIGWAQWRSNRAIKIYE
ncbi:MAG: hypothetical protein WC489_06050 [Patescibacteria group bacterium]|jgi:hypothetical protein